MKWKFWNSGSPVIRLEIFLLSAYFGRFVFQRRCTGSRIHRMPNLVVRIVENCFHNPGVYICPGSLIIANSYFVFAKKFQH